MKIYTISAQYLMPAKRINTKTCGVNTIVRKILFFKFENYVSPETTFQMDNN